MVARPPDTFASEFLQRKERNNMKRTKFTGKRSAAYLAGQTAVVYEGAESSWIESGFAYCEGGIGQ